AVLLDDRDAEHEIGLTQDVAAPGGQAYEVAVDIAAVPEAPPPANLYVQMRFLPSNTYAQEVLHTRQTAAFETIVLRGAMPAGDTTIRLYLYTHKGTAWTTALLDNVRLTGGVPAPAEPAALPSMKAPVVTQLKDAHLTTALVSAGRPAAGIVVASGRYAAAVAALQAAVRSRTGVELPVWSDRGAEAALPLRGARILLGNRSTNQAIGGLYDACFTLLDLKYPGPGGAVVHSLHNPYANGHNAILVGGSDDAGVERAAGLLAERLSAAPAGDALALGWVLDVRLPEGVVLPEDARHAETWDASDGYGSTGYFGWSSLSKCMAMYFMTGEPRHAREFVRLAFPDAQALKEISDIDGERIENKDDPLAGAYHYNQHMTLLYWDLIEESPVFSDDERLRITNGLARQLEHPDYAREGIFRLRGPAEAVSSRHGQWAAIGLLCLGRYFNRYYPDPVWEQCEQAGRWAFESLHKHAWVNGESDNLYWYSTGIAPIFTYLCLTGDREPLRQGTLAELLRGQEILLNGLPGDRQLQYAALTFLHQAAYLTGDGRWVGYRERTAMDTRIFRLGQSYWPDESLSPAAPTDLCGRWSIQPLPVPQWSRRGSGLTSDESFAFGSFRTETGPGGDFVLIDGFNGASRNPYHTFAILDLRLAGSTLLQGYLNQVLTKADGMVEPAVAMDAGLRWAERLGGTAGVSARVPRAAYCTWQRTLLQRLGRYALVIDDLAFRESSENMAVQTLWETRGGRWQPDRERARLTPRQGPRVPPGWMEFRALDAACTTQPADPGRLGRLTGVGIVLLRAQAPGEWLEMPFELEKPFAGEAYLDTVRYNDRGVVRVLIDGQAVQDRLNLYAGEARDERLSLGAVSLAAGRHVLRLEVVGHDESSARFFAALGALLLRPEGAAAEPAAPAVAYALSTADHLDVRGDATLTMDWNGPAEAGTNRLFFHLLSPDDAEAAGSFCRRLSPNAAFLRLPEPALAVVGAAEGVQAEVAILAADHLYGRGLTRAGLGPLLVSSEAPVAVDWDFATGEAALAVSAATTLTLALAEPGALRLDGQPVAALPLALPAGEHRLTGARPSAAVLSALRADLDAAGTQSAGLWDEAKAARTRATALPPSAALTVAPMASLPQGATEIIELPGLDQSPWLAVAEGSTVHLLTAAGAPVRTLQADGRVRVLAWWPEADALLVGCADEKLIAFARDGARRWV
ncbi:MAG: hypothetical protein GX595_20660, partial [Lentisphaerae bacterium]|nr:hypothetical protein [Lentisphaerota bacterium]